MVPPDFLSIAAYSRYFSLEVFSALWHLVICCMDVCGMNAHPHGMTSLGPLRLVSTIGVLGNVGGSKCLHCQFIWLIIDLKNIMTDRTSMSFTMHTLHGKTCMACVTAGHANDAPCLWKMIKLLPYGSGDVLGDAAYGSVKNCNVIRGSGRRPIINPKTGYVIKGYNARSVMLRFFEEYPGTFYKIYESTTIDAIRNYISKCG